MDRRPDTSFLSRVLRVSMIGAIAFVGLGCQKTALRPEDSRSPYDRYDQSRNQRAEPFTEDEFGKRTPNLRGRLIVRDD